MYVIDVKRYADATVEVRRSGGFLRSAREQLYIGGRDRTEMLDSVRRQVDAVRGALASYPGGADLHVTAALCFVDAQLPILRTPRIAGVPLLGVKGTTRLVATPGSLAAIDRNAVHGHLASALPIAR